ncbi:MAG: hypothetical protein IJQ81_08720 [Oscillibacter sp.]|nr:hypothetical protein [Oscillibacter sp.]
MSVTLEQTIGNSVIRIHDDCCRDTSEETVREILKRVSAYVHAEMKPPKADYPPAQS